MLRLLWRYCRIGILWVAAGILIHMPSQISKPLGLRAAPLLLRNGYIERVRDENNAVLGLITNISIAMKVARERKSAVLESNAIHHRVDSLTGIVALATIAIANIAPSLSSLDAVGGLLISWMVIRAGWGNTLTSLNELADASVPDEVRDKVRSVAEVAVREALPFGAEAKEVSGTKAGQNYLFDVEVAVPSQETIEQLNKAECIIRERIAKNVRGARRIRVRFVALDAEKEDFMHEFISPSVSAMATPELEKYEHGNGHGNGRANGKEKKDL
jgi:cation efflux family protein